MGVVVMIVVVVRVWLAMPMRMVVVVPLKASAPCVPCPNSARYSGASRTTCGVPSQQTCPFRQTTRSDAAITTCRSWLTSSTAAPVSVRTCSSRR